MCGGDPGQARWAWSNNETDPRGLPAARLHHTAPLAAPSTFGMMSPEPFLPGLPSVPHTCTPGCLYGTSPRTVWHVETPMNGWSLRCLSNGLATFVVQARLVRGVTGTAPSIEDPIQKATASPRRRWQCGSAQRKAQALLDSADSVSLLRDEIISRVRAQEPPLLHGLS